MANSEVSNELKRLTARQARDEVQLTLGQIHGVVWLAVNEVDQWPEKREQSNNSESELTADDIHRGGAEIHDHFGKVHAALNTGKYDEELVRVGLTGAQGQAKRKGLLQAIGRYFGSKAQTIQTNVTPLRGSLRWSSTLIRANALDVKGNSK